MFGWHPLDPLGFGRIGFEHARKKFTPLNPGRPELVVAVTGANSGVGLALTQTLATAGCTVYMMCRSLEKGEEARSKISPNDRLFVTKLDVSSLQSIKDLPSLPAKVDVLVQNAGMIAESYVETPDGLESTVATHVVGPYALREKLKPSRCIWVTSGGAYSQSLNVDVVFHPPKGAKFDGVKAYANCKRAQISLARLVGDDVMHPGWAASPGVQTSLPTFYEWTKNYLRTPEQGADTIAWLILNPPKERNYWFDRAPATEHKWYGRTASPVEEETKLLHVVRKSAGLE